MLRPAYAVEYDFLPAHQCSRSLMTKKIDGLFFSGQINGTTGYEEAAAQVISFGVTFVLLKYCKKHYLVNFFIILYSQAHEKIASNWFCLGGERILCYVAILIFTLSNKPPFSFSPFCRASFLVSMLPDTQMVSPSLFLKGRAATQGH